MSDVVQMPTANADKDASALCSPPPLNSSDLGTCDKLGNKILQLIWIGRQYAIYLSDEGVHIQLSNDPNTEKEQLKKFTVLCPELCDLRFLTKQMVERRPWIIKMFSKDRHCDHALYEDNMAQALMLLMEDKQDDARAIAKNALAMAVRRVTNDNTIRYLTACFVVGWSVTAICAAALLILPHSLKSEVAAMWTPYIVSAIFGAAGAIFSIMTRLRDFTLEPCEESEMNYWMSGMRVATGVMAAVTLVLFADTLLGDTLVKLRAGTNNAVSGLGWQTAALLGFIGGYAERLVPVLLHRTIDVMEAQGPIPGTPVQAARQKSDDVTTHSAPINKEPSRAIGTAG